MSAVLYPSERNASLTNRPHIARGILRTLLWILTGVLAVIIALPVSLLFIATAVPIAVSLVLVVADVSLVVSLFRVKRTWPRVMMFLVGWIAVSLLAVWLSHTFAMTPPILDTQGQPLTGSIATLEKVELGGSEQWISIRGRDIHKPVLLFLAGGPGGSQLATARYALGGLEEHFVVVNWEQPGAGKSFDAVDRSTLTPERYIADAHELILYLRQRFDEDKVYVLGESWGSALGVMLAQRYPDLFHAFIGTGQMVAFKETDILCYEFALRWAQERGDTQKVERLKQQGPPPYYGKGVAWKQTTYLLDTFAYMNQNPAIADNGFNTFRDLASPEYGLYDKVNWFRGVLETLDVVYPQLWEVDFRQQAVHLEVPVYFLLGRHDVNAPPVLAEEYYKVLRAPHKELIWFERSGHNPWVSESARFVEVMANTVLAETYPKAPPVKPPDNGPADAQEVEAFLDKLVPMQLHEHHLAGAAVAVVKDGQLLFAKGYGFSDLDDKQPVIAGQTLFHTDSTGKLFVWTAVMQLVEQGKLDLDADVNIYLDFTIPATFPQPITLAHLMSHNAGFEDYGYMFALDKNVLEPAGAWLARNLPARVRPPGVVSAYSNYGTGLAGYIVERVSGLPFEQYVEEEVFEPLAMHRSTLRQPLPITLAPDATTNYLYTNGVYNDLPFVYMRIPAGEAHTTVTDMAKFMMAHLQPGDSPILRAATAQQMHSRLFAHDPRVSGMAYGFAETTQNGQHILRHEGNLQGVSSSALFLLPEHNLGVYIAYNSNGGFGPGEQFRRAFLDHYFPAEAMSFRPIQLTAEQTNELVGTYRSTRMFHTSFAKILTLLGGNYADIQVSANTDGAFTTQGIGSTPLQWAPRPEGAREGAPPQVLRPVDSATNTHGDLVFASEAPESSFRLFVGNNPYRAFEKVAWYETIDLHLLWLALCELIFLSLLLTLTFGWLVRPAMRANTPNHLAQWLLAGACLLALLFPLGLVLTLEEALLYGATGALASVLALPLIAIALAAGAFFVIWRTWRRTSVAGRIPFVTAFVTMVAFVGWLNYWNLLGFRF
jgi:CubicO group peptidase (beta-lactamase class C family)